MEGKIILYSEENASIYVNVYFDNDTFWMTQKSLAELFDCSTDNISLHLKNIYMDEELNEKATTEEISVVQLEGARQVKRKAKYLTMPHWKKHTRNMMLFEFVKMLNTYRNLIEIWKSTINIKSRHALHPSKPRKRAFSSTLPPLLFNGTQSIPLRVSSLKPLRHARVFLSFAKSTSLSLFKTKNSRLLSAVFVVQYKPSKNSSISALKMVFKAINSLTLIFMRLVSILA